MMGGYREGAGRPKGTKNKATLELKGLAQQHTEDALKTLVEIMLSTESSDKARVAAANAILDRGFGKPHQSIDAEITGTIADITDDELDKRIAEIARQTGIT